MKSYLLCAALLVSSSGVALATGPEKNAAVTGGEPMADHLGVGGPEEPVSETWGLNTAGAASADYPPCSPGAGDDRCIQLYEPGVRQGLATWQGQGSAPQAVGGPYEPIEEHADAESDAEVDTPWEF